MTAGPLSDLLPASQVAELITGLGKALRAFHMYLPNNPIYQRATDNLRAAFSPIWAVLDELVLTVAETDFVWDEQVVYHQVNQHESLAYFWVKFDGDPIPFESGQYMTIGVFTEGDGTAPPRIVQRPAASSEAFG